MSILSVKNDNIGDSSFVSAQKPIAPSISGYSVQGTDDLALLTAGGQTVLINGTDFQRGATISLAGANIGVVTWISTNQLSFTSPANTAGTYAIYVINSDGGTAIYIPGIIYSTAPTWVTPAGTLGSYYETTSIATAVSATGDAPLTYALFSGAIPVGSTFYANGVLSGTAPVDSGSTTYTFSVEAVDAQLQGSTRSFNLTINTDVVIWVNPSPGATVSVLGGASYSTVLNATSAAGYNIATYTANALPAGLTLSGNTISGTVTEANESFSTLLTATASTSNRSATNAISWVINFNDLYWDYVTTLISANTPTTSVFVDDASTNNFPISIFGDTRPNNFGPYTPGHYSNFFDGTGDYLTVPYNDAFNIPINTAVTFECWVYTSSSATAVLAGRNWSYGGSGPTWGFSLSNGVTPSWSIAGTGSATYILATSTLSGTLGAWNHYAFTRDGSNVVRIFVNGVLGVSRTDGQAMTSASGDVFIGDSTNLSAPDFNGYISNMRFVKGTAVYTAAFTPPTQPLTAISNTSLLTCQSNRFIDNSANNFVITRVGTTAVLGFAPFVPTDTPVTVGSTYFDGTGDYLSVPDNTAFDFTGDFTMEAWVYPTVYSSNNTIVSQWISGLTFIFKVVTGNRLYFAGYPGSTVTVTGTTTTVNLNTWSHVAVTRSGSTIRLFVNGVLDSTTGTISGTLASTDNLTIGSLGTIELWNGNISNLRIIKGTALYITAFTPPTTPLTAITNTSLLTCQTNQPVNNNVFIDNSTNNLLITRAGNATQGTFSPYGENWSNYFDGTGDYLSVGGTASFNIASATNYTVEAWIYITGGTNTYRPIVGKDWSIGQSYPSFTFIISNTNFLGFYMGSGSGSTGYQAIEGTTVLAQNTWYHVAFVASGSTYYMFINGAVEKTGAITGTVGVGGNLVNVGQTQNAYNFMGYLSNVRIIKSALYTSAFTPSTTPLLPITGTSLLTCQSPNLVDNSANRFVITRNGDVRVEKFAPFAATALPTPYYSGYFDGSGDYLSAPANSAFQFTGNFTVEFWVNFNTLSSDRDLVGNYVNNAAPDWVILMNGSTIHFYPSSAASYIQSSTIVINTWYHIAAVKSGTTCRLYLNGVSVGTPLTIAGTVGDSSRSIFIGARNGASVFFNGYMSNVRIVKGTALYTATFTPPTAPLTAITNTSLLTCQNNTFIDNSTNNFAITAFGNAIPSQFAPFAVSYSTNQSYTPAVFGGSMYCDGVGDNLETQNLVVLAPGTNFTAECWVYNFGFSGSQYGRGIFSLVDTTNNERILVRLSQNGNNVNLYSNIANAQPFGGSGTNSTLTAVPMAWTHVALVRQGSSFVLYLNGVSAITVTSAANFGNLRRVRIGVAEGSTPDFNGYISDFRYVNGVAVYPSQFVPQNIPVTAVRSTVLLVNGTSAGVIDSSGINNYETVGDAKINTTVVKFAGTNSMKFDGTGDYLQTPEIISNSLGSANFTIEFWLYLPTLPSTRAQILYWNANTSGYAAVALQVCSSNKLGLSFSESGSTWKTDDTAGVGSVLTAATWQYVALVRNGQNIQIYLNGVAQGAAYTTTAATTSLMTTYTLNQIGVYNTSYSSLNGFISDMRITRGIARYTANFTPPTSPFQTT